MIEVIFSHGKEGSPHGSKSKIINDVCEAHNVKFTTIDYKECKSVNERVSLLDSKVKSNTNRLILVGSSMGGYVSAVCSNKYRTLGLFLIAPALYLTRYDVQEFKSLAANIAVRHGWDDDIISVDNSIKFCKTHNCALSIVDDDHRMSKTRHELKIHFTNFLKTCNAN
jgi:pimeloyl-ACP methyl ester carboxylesterase